MTSFSDLLRSQAGNQWNRVVYHNFTTELAAGTIDRQVLKKYLIQDYRFIDSFVILLSSMISNARSLTDRIPGCHFISVITGRENTYFERSFKSLGVTDEELHNTPSDTCTVALIDLMQSVARSGNLGQMLAVLVVCEWSYLCWGQSVTTKGSTRSINRDDFITYEWVDLHSGAYFEQVVEYLKGLLDKEGMVLDEAGKEECQAVFLQALKLEEEFFDNAFT